MSNTTTAKDLVIGARVVRNMDGLTGTIVRIETGSDTYYGVKLDHDRDPAAATDDEKFWWGTAEAWTLIEELGEVVEVEYSVHPLASGGTTGRGGVLTATKKIALGHGRRNGLSDVETARRVIAISALGDVELASWIVIWTMRNHDFPSRIS